MNIESIAKSSKKKIKLYLKVRDTIKSGTDGIDHFYFYLIFIKKISFRKNIVKVRVSMIREGIYFPIRLKKHKNYPSSIFLGFNVIVIDTYSDHCPNTLQMFDTAFKNKRNGLQAITIDLRICLRDHFCVPLKFMESLRENKCL